MNLEFPDLGHALTETFLKEESHVNGLWNSILHYWFNQNQYIIAPEYWTGGNTLRGDLAVLKLVYLSPSLCLHLRAKNQKPGRRHGIKP